MFTLEESALLRRMLHVVMWVVVSIGITGVLLLMRPWLAQLWVAAGAFARR